MARMSTKNKDNTALFAPIFIVIWSTGFIIARYGMPYSEPMTFLFLRFALVVACMLPVMIGVLMLPAVIRVVRTIVPAMQGASS